MEEGLLALSGSKSNINRASGVVVLSTLVALCGSFSYGCAVVGFYHFQRNSFPLSSQGSHAHHLFDESSSRSSSRYLQDPEPTATIEALENNCRLFYCFEIMNDEFDLQSMKMLKVRAALEEKLKQKGIFNSITPRTDRPQKHLKPLNGKLNRMMILMMTL
ncbi:uncharacterized protein LOC112181817 [Rosa chinensis]|uniref:uncharacterized protein LOC112181817 n=1 Tax=Rosa chinensis TaxID=74649 RepID=UPI001AD911A7|nr:uncharacterized protein LOC112181817 [Rosa chinensis]